MSVTSLLRSRSALLRRSLAVALLVAAAGAGASLLAAVPAQAVVYCTGPGYPAGCVVGPAPAVIYCTRPGYPVGCVARPAARAAVYCTRPGYPVGCVGRPAAAAAVATPGVGAPGVGVRPFNRGGPVNRIGVR